MMQQRKSRYLHGQCKRGDKCKFTHDENEKELLRIEKELAIIMKKEAQEKLDEEPKEEDEPVGVIDLEPDILLFERPEQPKVKVKKTPKPPGQVQEKAMPKKKVLPLKSKAKPIRSPTRSAQCQSTTMKRMCEILAHWSKENRHVRR